MSEQQQTEGTIANPSGNPAPQPAPQTQPSIPEGKRLVDASEYDQLSRQANNFKGSAPLIDRLVKSNIKSPDDLDRVLGSYQTLSELGVDVNQLKTAFRREEPVEQNQPQPEIDIESKINQTVNQRLAMMEHDNLSRRESELVQSAARKLAGEGASQAKLDAAKRLIEYEMRNDSAQLYDESDPVTGHLAKSYFKPHDERSLASVLEKVGVQWKELSASEIRDAAKRGTPTPGQGVTGGDGPTTEGKQNRPFAMLSREEKLQVLNRRVNEMTGGAPMSQA